MRWVRVSEKFPDDWESKILRTVGTRLVLDNNEWTHINDNFWNSGKRIDFQYDQIEWLDESEPDQDTLKETLSFGEWVKKMMPVVGLEDNQDILWEEVALQLNDRNLEGDGRRKVVFDWLKNKYTLIRK